MSLASFKLFRSRGQPQGLQAEQLKQNGRTQKKHKIETKQIRKHWIIQQNNFGYSNTI